MSTPIPSPESLESGHILTAEEAKRMAAELRKLPDREWDGKRLQALIRFGKARFGELYPNPWAMQDAVTVARVESLMDVPYDKLEFDDAMHRQVLGVHRSKETLSSIPFYANRAAKAAAVGKEWEYWRSLWGSGVNTMHPPKASSTPQTSEPTVDNELPTTAPSSANPSLPRLPVRSTAARQAWADKVKAHAEEMQAKQKSQTASVSTASLSQESAILPTSNRLPQSEIESLRQDNKRALAQMRKMLAG